MEKPFVKTLTFWILILVLLCLSVGTAYAVYTVQKTNLAYTALQKEFTSSAQSFEAFSASTTDFTINAEKKLLEHSDSLYQQQITLQELQDAVKKYIKQVSKLSGNVETLEKLTTTDPELLQKYSKIYFLNENYKPADLSVIPEKFDLVDGKQVSIHSQVLPFLEDLLDDAKDDGIDIKVLSGYRSFADQEAIKVGYSTRYGLGANQFSADQGYSEHQLGTTVDFTSYAVGQNLESFQGSDVHNWLMENAAKYGFVMSYPENNEFYIYEPWHWRFVGEDLARDLKKKNKSFYDLEQREIDEYVATLFD